MLDCPAVALSSKPAAGTWTRVPHAACLWILAAVFVMSGVSKLVDPGAFRDQLILHAALSPNVALLVAAFLPWLELVCGLSLAVGWSEREAASILTGVLVVLLGYTLTHGGDTDCGCFFFPRVVRAPSWWPATRNILLLACSVAVARKRGSKCISCGSRQCGFNFFGAETGEKALTGEA